MEFSQIYGNEDVKRALTHCVEGSRLPHAIMFEEIDGGGALALTLAFLQFLNCKNKVNSRACGCCPSCVQMQKLIHPNVLFTFPVTTGSKVSGKVSDISSQDYIKYWNDLAIQNPYFTENQLISTLGLEKKTGIISTYQSSLILKYVNTSSMSGGIKTVVIWLPEKMNQTAANTLLKSLEEPGEGIMYILITHSPNEVMQTISSRCLRIRLQPNTKEEIQACLEKEFNIDSTEAKNMASIAGGSIGQALYMLSDQKLSSEFREIFSQLLEKMLARDLFSVIQIGEEIANMDSREKQKSFCEYVGAELRKIFMIQQGLPQLACIPNDYIEYYNTISKKIGKKFCSTSIKYLDKANMLLERNVNQKILFCNLVCRMFFVI